MADVTINYEGNEIASMSASGTKTLLTQGKYCTDDIEVVYVSPGGGGGNTFYYTHIDSLCAVSNGPGPKPTGIGTSVIMDLPNCESIRSAFSQYIGTSAYSSGITYVELTLYMAVDAYYFLRRNYPVVTVVFPNGIAIKGDARDAFNAANLTTVTGEIDISAATNIGNFCSSTTTKLETISFKQNSIPLSITFVSDNLTNASIISIANGLDESKTGQTLTHEVSIVNTMGSIMGNVAMDGTNTYHIFTEDAGGNTTLLDFVTITKGWTVA